jgi:hypothetical protein
MTLGLQGLFFQRFSKKFQNLPEHSKYCAGKETLLT